MTPACVGSNPAAPANDSLAQLVEHLTFNQGVPSSNLGWITNFFLQFNILAGVAELADALDLGSSVLRRAGSTPVTRTNTNKVLSDFRKVLFFYKKNVIFILKQFLHI